MEMETKCDNKKGTTQFDTASVRGADAPPFDDDHADHCISSIVVCVSCGSISTTSSAAADQ